MNAPAPDRPDDALARVQELLPWHAVDALDAADRAFVEQWLEQHAAGHAEVQAELAWLRSTAALAREIVRQRAIQGASHGESAASTDAGLGDLMSRIAADRARTTPQPTWAGRLARRLSRWLADTLAPRPALAFGLAAVLVVQTLAVGVLLTRDHAEQAPLAGPVTGAVSGTPSGTSSGSVVFTIALRANVLESDWRGLLLRSHAQIVAGPSALGLYRVAVPAAEADSAAAQLQAASAIVESAQREP